MTAGYSGSYGINGTNLLLPPTTGRWIPLSPLGITGDGHSVYSAIHDFEIRWNIVSQQQLDQLLTTFNSVSLTGTLVVDLPKYNGVNYLFESYTGCTISQPERGVYFTEHTTNYAVMISNIRV